MTSKKREECGRERENMEVKDFDMLMHTFLFKPRPLPLTPPPSSCG